MCYTKYFKHPKCGCWSVKLTKPCKKGRNFANCPMFENGIACNPKSHPQEEADKGKCPKHDKKGANRKKVQMVSGAKHGFKWGCGPNENDFGIDVLCGDPKGLREKEKKATSDSEGSESGDSEEESEEEEFEEEESEEESSEEEEEGKKKRKRKPIKLERKNQVVLCTVM
ncbi:hypothetical protein JMJ35_002768 [Cladonia borealis]|uniref:Uncharacterized protein n=1 Tax=Cladonia borealis TaxID=184061 RepID=A0AA39R808_9LECA|nr:hypothetical protein JMJ35_002768 [Cladonia borealis]